MGTSEYDLLGICCLQQAWLGPAFMPPRGSTVGYLSTRLNLQTNVPQEVGSLQIQNLKYIKNIHPEMYQA
jgi:hypothetical protein